jgi:hypothetical protein
MRFALAALFVTQTLLSAPPPHLETRLSRELDRLDVVLKTIDSPALAKDVKPIVEGNRMLLNRARAATSPLVRLYRMRDAYVGIETLRYVLEHKSDESSLAAVQALADASRASIDKRLPAISGPALQVALRQIVANRAQKLLRASVPFGKAASPANGLFYIGEAEGNRRFRDYLETLPFGTGSEPQPNPAAIRSTLARLDTAALAAFEEDPAGRSAVPLSARLKEARELADRGMLEGASLTMLEAQLGLQRRGTAIDAPTSAATPHDSIAAMFANENKEVLPLYASLFSNAPAEKKIPKNVTVTLVRWPYT